MAEGWDYRKAGLDLDIYEQTLGRIAALLHRTQDPFRVLPPPFPPRRGGKGSSGFAALFDLDPNAWLFRRRYKHPVLVACTDGVGSKLKLATLCQRYDTVGIDLVAMSVNDLICTGGEPLMFLDYLALPKDDPDWTATLIRGISEGCQQADCSLVGGETAILPDTYQPGDFDMAGFAVGVVERDRIVDGRHIRPGDLIIGLASSGPHSNGYTLIRKIVFEAAGLHIDDEVPECGARVGELLLTPTRIYVRPIRRLIAHYPVKKRVLRGFAHITGGGIIDNLARILPPTCRAIVHRGRWPLPAVFTWIQRLGNVPDAEMFRVFNMGIGFTIVCAPAFANSIVSQLEKMSYPAWIIGEIQAGEVGVDII
ncbi:MAG: phosphoribosylformylglycinamidine cyclo-ligase [Gemmataceae bacterium]|nr:phosphoribosylformylglycinamidine cyclo-ligase [Gemmataceae bacterium]